MENVLYMILYRTFLGKKGVLYSIKKESSIVTSLMISPCPAGPVDEGKGLELAHEGDKQNRGSALVRGTFDQAIL